MADPHQALNPKASYAAIVAGKSESPNPEIVAAGPPFVSNVQHSSFKGEPAIIIPTIAEETMAVSFQRSLIGKFSQGRPPFETMQKFLRVQNYKGKFSYGLLDNKHLIFRFEHDEDYIRLFSKPSWHVGSKVMRIFKWTVDFHVDREPSIIPVWISLPKLPIHLMNKAFIFHMMELIGKPLRLDSATTELRRPSLARVQVEIDILKVVPRRIWIQKENGDGFWQRVDPEGTCPAYCKHCWHMGHTEDNCMIKNPSLAPTNHTKNQPLAPSKPTQIYVVKNHNSENTMVTDSSQPIITGEASNVTRRNEFEKNQVDDQGKTQLDTQETISIVNASNSAPPEKLLSPIIGRNEIGKNHVDVQGKTQPNAQSNSAPPEKLLRPIIYDKHSSEATKLRFLRNMGRSSDSESNKARAEKTQQEFHDHQDDTEDEGGAFYTED